MHTYIHTYIHTYTLILLALGRLIRSGTIILETLEHIHTYNMHAKIDTYSAYIQYMHILRLGTYIQYINQYIS